MTACSICGCGAVEPEPDGGADASPSLAIADLPTRHAGTSFDVADARARFPWNGYRTGSAVVPLDAPIRDHPLKPRFVWNRAAGATHYELEVDDSCAIDAFRACDFASPEARVTTTDSTVELEEPLPVSMTAPVGRRYYWRVRACDEVECSAWSEVRYLHVGRAEQDYDGDGYSDLLVFVEQDYDYEEPVGYRRLVMWRGGPMA